MRRRLGGNNINSQRRDRSIPEDDHPQTETNPSETISADDILARYSNKGATNVDNGTKMNTIADEGHRETITVNIFTIFFQTKLKGLLLYIKRNFAKANTVFVETVDES